MLNVMYATNSNQIFTLCYSLISLLKHNKDVHIFLCTNSEDFEGSNPFSEKQIKWLKGLVRYMDSNSFLEQVEIKDIYNEVLKDNPNEKIHWTRNAMTRLLADRIFLPRGISEIMYFDPDTMFTGNIIPLLYSLNNYDIALKSDKSGVLVSGVEYLNLVNLKKKNFFDDAIELLNKEKLRFPDQDATIYSIHKNEITFKDFNNQEVFFGKAWEKQGEPLIYHFCCDIPVPVGILSEEQFIEVFPNFSYVKDLLDNYRSAMGFNFS